MDKSTVCMKISMRMAKVLASVRVPTRGLRTDVGKKLSNGMEEK